MEQRTPLELTLEYAPALLNVPGVVSVTVQPGAARHRFCIGTLADIMETYERVRRLVPPEYQVKVDPGPGPGLHAQGERQPAIFKFTVEYYER